MIFSTGILKTFSDSIFKNLTTILVYSGNVPTAGTYISEFLTTYNSTGARLLQAYNGLDLDVRAIEQGYQIYKITSSEYSTFSKQSGTATWAALIDNLLVGDLITFDAENNLITFNRSITTDDLFMIVPVTDSGSNGVLRFATTEFSHPANEILNNFELDFTFN